MIPLICIEGATGSGKSLLALKLAKLLDTEIISADSRQVYKYLNIGTAKPDFQTLSEIKHHLIDIILPNQRYSAGAFVKDAETIIKKLHSEEKTPIICGGSMLYIKSLLEGLSEIPEIPLEAVNKTKEFMLQNDIASCYDFVISIDPKFAQSITSTDKQRISRAIEVWFAFEKPITSFWDAPPPAPPINVGGFSPHIYGGGRGGIVEVIDEEQTGCLRSQFLPFKICLDKDRNKLYNNINKRMLSMINLGLIEEIKTILDLGFKKDDYGLNSVGYKEFLEMVISNDFSKMKECIELAAQHTRNYAKRQYTWYRKESFDVVLCEDKVNIETLKEKIQNKLRIRH